MEERVLTLKNKIMKHHLLKKENLNPKAWINSEHVKGFTDFVLQKEPEADKSFDNVEMLLETEKEYIEAAKRNDVETMKLLGRAVNVNAKNVHNRTALHYAVACKSTEAVDLLIKRRAKLDFQDKYGVTAVHLAAWFGSLEILKLLVQGGADQRVETMEGMNMMHCAAVNDHTDIVAYIVDDLQMKELDKEDQHGNRPFAVAAEHGCVQMLQMLMEEPYKMATMVENQVRSGRLRHIAVYICVCNASPRCPDDHLCSDFVTAYVTSPKRSKCGMLSPKHPPRPALTTYFAVMALLGTPYCLHYRRYVVKYIPDHLGKWFEPNVTKYKYILDNCMPPTLWQQSEEAPHVDVTKGDTPLHLAAKNGQLGAVQLLLDYFEVRNEVNHAGETPLYLAADGAHENCVLALMDAGCDPNIPTTNGIRPLHSVCEKGHMPVVKLLVERGAHMDIQNQHLQSPYYLAVKNCHNTVIETLLESGCDTNITDHMGQTALHIAAELGKVEVTEIILKAGVNMEIKDRQGKTALGVAARADAVIIVDMIIKAERYFGWIKSNAETNEDLHDEFSLTFKPDHRTETKEVRSMLWNLAYRLLNKNEWKKLAEHWAFTEEQIAAIEEQWTGPNSHHEHGNRMLLIWLHGVLVAQKNPAKELHQGLIATGNIKIAEKLRMEDSKRKCKIS